MSTAAFRAEVTQLLVDWAHDNYPDMDVCWENGPVVDQKSASSPWLDVEMRFHNGKNVTVGTRPRGRDFGVLATNIYVRAGECTARADELLDGLRELLRNRRVGAGLLEYPQRTSSPQMLGWYRTGLLTPFYVDSE